MGKILILIAHRGNINGPNEELENSPELIDNVVSKGYDCEIDLWEKDDLFYLGHNEPKYEISITDLIEWKNHIWIHAKNSQALKWLSGDKLEGGDFNFFWHENDKFTLTSNGTIWCFPSQTVYNDGINLMPEWNNHPKDNFKDCLGICTDYIERYK